MAIVTEEQMRAMGRFSAHVEGIGPGGYGYGGTVHGTDAERLAVGDRVTLVADDGAMIPVTLTKVEVAD